MIFLNYKIVLQLCRKFLFGLKKIVYNCNIIGLDVVKSEIRWKFSYSREPISTYIFLLNINLKNLVTFFNTIIAIYYFWYEIILMHKRRYAYF